MDNITKQVMPLGAALALGWLLAQIGYGAGAKVSSGETTAAFLSARLDGVVKAADKASVDASNDHDKLTKFENEVENLQREMSSIESRLQNQAPIKLDVSGGK